ncbi:MAG: type II toxin-antitoxin system VapC family toxin [Elusimicrobia bacterium]|nr:type II toxin-antitoxin system VapC family toxin [Elusimicrobiota bacterium]
MIAETLLVDTHVWFWWATGDDRLKGTKALRALEASSQENRVFLSVISLWEVGMLSAKGRLHLFPDVRQWVDRALRETSVQLAPLTGHGALASTCLPGEFHGDPADRIRPLPRRQALCWLPPTPASFAIAPAATPLFSPCKSILTHLAPFF